MENENPYALTYDEMAPDKQVRTDLWGAMAMPDLVLQRDLLISRMEKTSRMFSNTMSPSIVSMYSAMQMALNDINGLIDKQAKK